MKSIFDKTAREELAERINLLTENSNARWGKMNVYQMAKHCSYWNGWVLGDGDYYYKQAFIGKVFGKIGLKKMIKNENPFSKNLPTTKEFKIRETNGDLEDEKSKWISNTMKFEKFDNPGFIHDFFGKINKEEIGILVYKHADHHLRQFGV